MKYSEKYLASEDENINYVIIEKSKILKKFLLKKRCFISAIYYVIKILKMLIVFEIIRIL